MLLLISELIMQNLHAFHFTKFYMKNKNFIFILQPIEINLSINLVKIRNANICILGLAKSILYSFLLLVEK